MATTFTDGEIKMICLLMKHLDGPLNINWDEAVKDGGYQSIQSLRSCWNKLKRNKLAPAEGTPKKRKVDNEGGRGEDAGTPTKKRSKGTSRGKKDGIEGADGAQDGSDDPEEKVKVEPWGVV